VSEEAKSSVLPILMGAVVAIVIGIGVFVAITPSEPQLASVVQENAAPALAPAVAAEAPAAPEPNIPSGPQFDTFRVETDGSVVIAGRAEPGQVVDVILAGEAIERVTADATGSFVAFPMAGPSDAPRRLSLLADPDGAPLASETSYIVSPIAAPVVVAAPLTDPVVADDNEVASAALPTVPTLPEVAETVDVPVAALTSPTVLLADADGVRVVQSSPALSEPNVALDAITYDPQGEVQLAGRATGDGAVQVYINNEPLTASPVTQGGDWRIDLPSIDTGVYTLRIDEVDTEGDVVSRLETPFKREEAANVAAVLAEETAREGFEVAVKTVQPGATLWAIAEENLGSGIYYVEVFEANADLIRDPNLIYPGQIFRMPEITQ
jgi:nucleoid-associated protein YgaU